MGRVLLTCAALAALGILQGVVPAEADEPRRARPLYYVLLVDASASMAEVPKGRDEPKSATVQRVLTDFVRGLPPGADALVATFHQGIQQRLARRIGGGGDREALAQFVAAVRADGRGTHAWSSLAAILADAQEWIDQHPDGEVRLFVYTDGEDTTGANLEDVLKPYERLLAGRSVRARFFTLGFTLRAGLGDRLEKLHIGVEAVPDLADLVPPLVVDLDWSPREPVRGGEVVFRDRSTGWARQYRWRFGDGRESAEKAPTHRYERDGRFEVTLEIEDAAGHRDSVTRSLTVRPPEDPVLEVNVTPSGGDVLTEFVFVERSRGALSGFAWEFGDGASAEGPIASHRYGAPGHYDVTLSAAVADGRRLRSTPVTVEVAPPAAPTARVRVPGEVEPGRPVRLLSETTGGVTSYAWDFGDGETASEPHPEHAWQSPGSYEVSLTVTGPGGSGDATGQVRVRPPPAPRAAFTPGTQTAVVGQTVYFLNLSQGPIDVAHWDFGDGSPSVLVEAEPLAPAAHRFDHPGEFVVTLEVRGPGGTDSTRGVPLAVTRPTERPVADFRVRGPEGPGPARVGFENTSRGGTSGFTWDFGDGSEPLRQAERRDVEHEFPAGSFQVTLTAHGLEGHAADVAVREVRVPEPPGFLARWWWAIGLLALIGALVWGALVRSRREARERRLASLLDGDLSVRRPPDAWVPLASITAAEGIRAHTFTASSLPDSVRDPGLPARLGIERTANGYHLLGWTSPGSPEEAAADVVIAFEPGDLPGEWEATVGSLHVRFQS